jgi:hypothetical protein
MTVVTFPQAQRTALFIAAERTLIAEMGNVSIVKFLGGREEGKAQAIWFAALEGFLAALPAGVFIGPDVTSGAPVLRFSGGVDIRLDLYDLQARPSLFDAWRVRVKPGLAPVVTDAVAANLWGAQWDAAIADSAGDATFALNPVADTWSWATAVREEIAAVAGGDDARARGWVVRAGPTEAPWPWFSDETRAHRAAKALALGGDAINALYQRFAGRTS